MAWALALALASAWPIDVLLATDRMLPAVATLNSVCSNTEPSRLRFHLVVPDSGQESVHWPEQPVDWSDLPRAVGAACRNATFMVWTMPNIERAIEDLRGVKPSWSPERDLMTVPHDRSSASWPLAVHVAAWDQDAKHASPFNHVRFYAPELLRDRLGIETLIMLDDDGTTSCRAAAALRRGGAVRREFRRC